MTDRPWSDPESDPAADIRAAMEAPQTYEATRYVMSPGAYDAMFAHRDETDHEVFGAGGSWTCLDPTCKEYRV